MQILFTKTVINNTIVLKQYKGGFGMIDLIKVKDGDIKVSSFTLAEGFNVDKRSIDNLIQKNTDTLSRWGDVDKVIGRSQATSKRGGHNKVEYFLNEQQTMYILTYTKRTKHTDAFRVRLIDAFIELRKQANGAQELLNQSIKMLEQSEKAGSNWGKLGQKIKQERKPILETIENAHKLLQIELKFEG